MLQYEEGEAMPFGIYALGYLVLIAGVCVLAHAMRIPTTYIAAIALILAGMGIVAGAQRNRRS
jgi:hypothetical protein